ncbi:MAG: phosphotyrosine protein phosphatase [Pseudomonadota bacterium]
MTRALFLCGKARMRSPTAARIARQWADTDYAGLSNDADVPLERDQVDWADIIFVMERRQAKRLTTLFGDLLADRRVVVLDIPDRYAFGDPDLIDRLTPRLRAVLAK